MREIRTGVPEQMMDVLRKRVSLTPEQQRRRAEVHRRNAEIQRVGPRPVDGVTFAKKGKAA